MIRRLAAPALAALTIAVGAATLPAANAQAVAGGGKAKAAEQIAGKAATAICEVNPRKCEVDGIVLLDLIEKLLFGF